MTLKTLTVSAPIIETDVLKYVVDDDFCKEEATLSAGDGSDNVVEIGTVLGLVGGKYWPLDLGRTDGAQDAAAISLSKRTAVEGSAGDDEDIVILECGPAIVDSLHLLWPAGITDNEKAAALVQLRAKNIKARAS